MKNNVCDNMHDKFVSELCFLPNALACRELICFHGFSMSGILQRSKQLSLLSIC